MRARLRSHTHRQAGGNHRRVSASPPGRLRKNLRAAIPQLSVEGAAPRGSPRGRGGAGRRVRLVREGGTRRVQTVPVGVGVGGGGSRACRRRRGGGAGGQGYLEGLAGRQSESPDELRHVGVGALEPLRPPRRPRAFSPPVREGGTRRVQFVREGGTRRVQFVREGGAPARESPC